MCTTGDSMIGLQLGSAVTGGIGSYFSAAGQRANLKASASAADLNARIAEMQGQDALRTGQRQEQASKIATRNTRDAVRAGYAAQGIDLASETAINVITSVDTIGEIEANTINANAARAAWGYKTQGTQFEAEAATRRATSKGISPVGSSATSLMNSAGDIAKSWYKLDKSGAEFSLFDFGD